MLLCCKPNLRIFLIAAEAPDMIDVPSPDPLPGEAVPATLTESPHPDHATGPAMAKKPTPASESVRLPADLARKARVIASARGISLPEYLIEKLGPIVERELPEVMRMLGLDQAEDRPKK